MGDYMNAYATCGSIRDISKIPEMGSYTDFTKINSETFRNLPHPWHRSTKQ